MLRRHVVLALVVAVCWAVNFVVIDIGLKSFPPLLFAALRFGLTALPAIFFVPRPGVRWRAVVAVGLFIGVGQFGVLFVAMNIGLPAGLASVIAPLQPVFTIPLAVIALGERPSLREVIGALDSPWPVSARSLPVAPMASLFRQSRSVSRPRHRGAAGMS